MKLIYTKSIGTLLLMIIIIGSACGQKTKAQTKIKTITIVNGDTTIKEEVISGDDFKWEDKDEAKGKNVKVMKFVSSEGDTTEMKEIETKIKMLVDEDGNGEKMHKKIIMIDENGKTKTIETENAFAFEMDMNHKGGKQKVEWVEEEVNSKGGEKHIKKRIHTNEEKALPLKNVSINVDTKTQTIKLDLLSETEDAINVIVMDENGKQVFYDTQKSGKNYKKDIKLSKKGTYFLTVIQNKKSLNEKIIIE